jgi:hypothetical protein
MRQTCDQGETLFEFTMACKVKTGLQPPSTGWRSRRQRNSMAPVQAVSWLAAVLGFFRQFICWVFG